MSYRGQVRFLYVPLLVLAALCLTLARSCGQPWGRSGRIIKPVAKEAPVSEDFVRFTNGDVLSGRVEGIVEGVIEMKPEMAEGTLAIPVEAVKEVVFKDTEEASSFSADDLVLTNGESLSCKIEGMTDGKVVLSMPSSQKIELDVQDVAAMSFYKRREVLAEESFDSGLPKEMDFEGGRWRTEKGWLLQSDSRAAECYASLPVTQTGELVYEWCVNTTAGPSTGIYFMASDPGLSQERAYSLRVLRKYVYVYMCMNGEEVYCGSYRVSPYRNRNVVRLRCDSGRGRIEMWIDGAEVGSWDSSVPIKIGKYVVLRADGRAAFDDLSVVRTAGAARINPMPYEGEGELLTLVNGDEITGKVQGVSQSSVSFTEDNSDEVRKIAREKLLFVRFGRKSQKLPRAKGDTVVLMMRNGDRISGEQLSLKEETVRIKSELAGAVDLRREDVKKVIFREFP